MGGDKSQIMEGSCSLRVGPQKDNGRLAVFFIAYVQIVDWTATNCTEEKTESKFLRYKYLLPIRSDLYQIHCISESPVSSSYPIHSILFL